MFKGELAERWSGESLHGRQEALDLLIAGFPLPILVWGPGENSADYDKRILVVEHLRKNGFPECSTSEELIKSSRYEDHDLLTAEWMQWLEHQLVIILEQSIGPLAERCSFAFDPLFCDKAFVLVKEEHFPSPDNPSGYTGKMLDRFRNKAPYTQEEWDKSELRKKCLRHARKVRTGKFLEAGGYKAF